MVMNQEIKNYFNVLCNGDYPSFINKYLTTKEMERLKYIGQFCGCDYSGLYNIKYWYSRFDHSVATSLITWNLTKDKTQTLAALFHDLGTPVFSHCVDFMLGDSVNQETSEIKVSDIIIGSEEICKLLKEDQISAKDVSDVSKYPIIENKSPRLCADRLEGVLHTVLIWLNLWSLDMVKDVYKDICILINEDGISEIGFNNVASGEKFFEAVYEYSIELQRSENKFTLQYIGDALKHLIKLGYINKNDLYKLKEEDIVEIFKGSIDSWNLFSKINSIEKSEDKPEHSYYVCVESKKRYVIPLCNVDGVAIRLNEISNDTKLLLSRYQDYKDSKYSFIKGI